MKRNNKLFLFFLICLITASGCLKQTSIKKEQPESPIIQEEVIEKEFIPEKVKFIFTGDIMIHKTFLTTFNRNNKYDFSPLYSEIKDQLIGDIVFGNLETTLAGETKKYSGYPVFRSPDSILNALKFAGFTHLNLANNHCMDSGIKGLFRTKNVCEEMGFTTIGTYNTKEENHFLIEDIKGIKFGFLSYTYGTNGINPPKDFNWCVSYIEHDKIKNEINELKKHNVHFIFVILHFGKEYTYLPDKSQKELVKFLFENDVNFVIGMHPHTIQPFTFNGDDKNPKFVIYSLGNFSSVQAHHKTDIGATLLLEFEKSIDGSVKFSSHDFTIIFRKKEVLKDRYNFVILPYTKAVEDEQISSLKKESLKKFKEILSKSTDFK